jgi:hypothetical protein
MVACQPDAATAFLLNCAFGESVTYQSLYIGSYNYAGGNSYSAKKYSVLTFWVMTNSPISQKKQMLRDALRLLGYSGSAVIATAATIKS